MSQTYVPAHLRRLVRERAKDCCEYCLMPESVSFASHWIDHIVAEKHGGKTEADNLANSCILCNQRKGSDLGSIDPDTGALTPLFHPRRDRWADHFRLVKGLIAPLTPIGRVTVGLLQLNHPDRIDEREQLIAAGVLPIAMPSES
jgi:hypothetical protein